MLTSQHDMLTAALHGAFGLLVAKCIYKYVIDPSHKQLDKQLHLLLAAGLSAPIRSLLAANSYGFYQGSANTMTASNTAAAIADAANGRIPASYATK
jgi:hypothetical protein